MPNMKAALTNDCKLSESEQKNMMLVTGLFDRFNPIRANTLTSVCIAGAQLKKHFIKATFI